MKYKLIQHSSNDPITETSQGYQDIQKINPWLEPIHQITWGFVLTSLTLNFLLLQYILPTIGILLMYLGFRTLRNTNQKFFTAWILATSKLIWQLVQLVIYSTPIVASYKRNLIIITFMFIFQIIQLSVFRKALRSVYQKAGITLERNPITSAILWICIISIFTPTKLANLWIILIPLILSYIMIFRSIYHLGDALTDVSYAYVNAPVKYNGEIITLGYLFCCFAIVTISSVFSNHLSLDCSKQPATSEAKTREELIQLGFPQNIISDINDQDISMLHGAIFVKSISNDLNWGDSNLQATTIYIEFADNLLYVIVHLNWLDSKIYWQDGFTINVTNDIKLLNGVLLFKKNGVDYNAPIPRLQYEYQTTKNWFTSNVSKQISGAISYPYLSTNQRGYVFYKATLPKEQWDSSNCLNYVHNTHPFHIPYIDTEKRISSSFTNGAMQQQCTTFEMKAYRDTLTNE